MEASELGRAMTKEIPAEVTRLQGMVGQIQVLVEELVTNVAPACAELEPEVAVPQPGDEPQSGLGSYLRRESDKLHGVILILLSLNNRIQL